MSLLIKALATAEKDKQAELKKKQADIGHAPQSLELAPLLPIDTALEQVVENQNLAEEVTTTNATREQTETKALELTAALGNGLSLEEETGFAAAKMAENNSAKSRAASNKVSAKFDAPHANNKAEAFNAAALASVAHAKSQAAAAQDSKQKAAANVFVANQSLKNTSSKSALILLGVAGALMVWLGLHRDQAVAYVGDHTSRLPVVMLARVGRMWDLYRPAQNVRFNDQLEGRGRRASQVGLAMYYLLLPLAAVGAVWLWRRRITLIPLVAPMLVITVTAALAFGTTRYRIPADVALVVLAGLGLAALVGRWGRRAGQDGPDMTEVAP